MTQNTGEAVLGPARPGLIRRLYSWLSKRAGPVLVLIILGWFAFSLARAAIYKIRPYERGLHLRGGRFIGIDEPGWHIRIPFVDTTIGLLVSERPGEIEQLAAMTSDDVTMDVSLLYTYRVVDPVQYQLEVLSPERIVMGFVTGTLRDVINTKTMAMVMHSRAEINRDVMAALREKEAQYGVEFILVQIQSASPPAEVVTAIKDRMVSVEKQEQSLAEAAQLRTVADSEFYAAQKQADGEAYQIVKQAEAEAKQIELTSQAKQEAVRAMLQELAGRGDLAEQYIQVLIAQELQPNSKWIISGGETTPVIELRETP
jgi:regulator of protease activity HflC (stomatin/prohibitin superfamily)